MSDERSPDPRFRAWLADQAPDGPPAGMLPEIMRRIDASGQQRRWVPAWPMRGAIATTATVAVIAIAVSVGVVLSGLPPDAGPPASVAANPSASQAASSSPGAEALDPTAVARIALPHAGAQTAFEVAVSEDRIWIVTPEAGGHLIGIDTTTNAVISDVPISPASIVGGDGGVWMVSPYGGAPNPAMIELSRVDEATGQPRLLADYPFADRLAVGLGHVWLGGVDITKIDPSTGESVASFAVSPLSLTVACGALWAWELTEGDEESWTLGRLDPMNGEILDEIVAPVGIGGGPVEMDGRCWLQGHNTLLAIEPGRGIVDMIEVPPVGTLRIAGETVWSVRAANVIQRVNPATGAAVGPMWQLPGEDLHEDPRGAPDWRLLSADGSLWVLGAEWLVRYDIPTAEELPAPTSLPTQTATPVRSVPVIPPEPSNPIFGREPVTDRDVINSFTLVLRSSQDRYRAGQPIDVRATLTFTGAADRVVALGSGSGIVVFWLETADGTIRIDPAGTSDCTGTEIAADRPMVVAFAKSGGYGYEDPLAPFYQAYFADPDLRLPAGTWTLRAIATFSTGKDCGDVPSRLETSVTIVIEP